MFVCAYDRSTDLDLGAHSRYNGRAMDVAKKVQIIVRLGEEERKTVDLTALSITQSADAVVFDSNGLPRPDRSIDVRFRWRAGDGDEVFAPGNLLVYRGDNYRVSSADRQPRGLFVSVSASSALV